ncbi:MAG: hypothetical protein WD557_04585 [Dehalococcoidia bacterium]
MPTRDGTMKTREWVFYAEEVAMRALPAELAPPERKVMWTVLQFHYGDPNVHFEVNPSPGRQQVELGLHFEGPPGSNDAWVTELARRGPEYMAALGDEWELEEWTASWRRLHRVLRFERLDTEFAHVVAGELVKAFTVLGPFVREGPHPPAPSPDFAGEGERVPAMQSNR